eukprot:3157474-Amphidinium_carterae.1
MKLSYLYGHSEGSYAGDTTERLNPHSTHENCTRRKVAHDFAQSPGRDRGDGRANTLGIPTMLRLPPALG